MAIIKPILVDSSAKLDEAIKACKPAILVVNADLIPAIKKEIKREDILIKSKKESSKAVKGGLVTVAAATIAGVFAPPAVIIPAAIAATGGVVATIAGTASSMSNALRKYAWVETTHGDSTLLIVKVAGRNKFDKKEDEIHLTDIGYNVRIKNNGKKKNSSSSST